MLVSTEKESRVAVGKKLYVGSLPYTWTVEQLGTALCAVRTRFEHGDRERYGHQEIKRIWIRRNG